MLLLDAIYTEGGGQDGNLELRQRWRLSRVMLLFTLILHRLTWCVLSSFPSKKRKDNKSYLKYAMSVGVKCVWRVALLEASNFLKILDVVTTPYCEVYKYWPRWILIYKRLDLSYVRSMRHCQSARTLDDKIEISLEEQKQYPVHMIFGTSNLMSEKEWLLINLEVNTILKQHWFIMIALEF